MENAANTLQGQDPGSGNTCTPGDQQAYLVRFDDGIHATLSFNRTPVSTFVPWAAVYLIADFEGNGAVWQDDIPADMLEAITPAPDTDPPKTPPKPIVAAPERSPE